MAGQFSKERSGTGLKLFTRVNHTQEGMGCNKVFLFRIALHTFHKMTLVRKSPFGTRSV